MVVVHPCIYGQLKAGRGARVQCKPRDSVCGEEVGNTCVAAAPIPQLQSA